MDIEFENTKLLNLPDGYYLADRKYQVLIEESERIKCQRLIARRTKGSSNRYKAVKKLRRHTRNF